MHALSLPVFSLSCFLSLARSLARFLSPIAGAHARALARDLLFFPNIPLLPLQIAAGGLWNKHFFRMLCSDFGSYVQLHPDPGGTSDQNEYIQQFRASRQPTTVGPAHAAEIAACTRRLALASYAVRAGLGEAAGPWLRDARDACDAVAGLTRMAVYDTEEPSTPADKEGLLLTGTIVRKGLVLIEPKSNRPASFGTNSTKRTPIPGHYGGD